MPIPEKVAMHNLFPRPDGVLPSQKIAVENLMRCPLCGTVNSKMNLECFVCRWHGEFDHDAWSVEEGLLDVLEQCPELIDCIVYTPRKRDSLFVRAREWINRRTRKRLNLQT